jgi:hypothetical protein
MKFNKETILALPGLSPEQRGPVAALGLAETFTASEFFAAYKASGAAVPHIVRAYGALFAAGLLHDTGAIWKIARLAFAVQREGSGLRPWAEKLGPENWQQAEADAFATSAQAAVDAPDASDPAEAAAEAAEAAAYADEAAYAAFQAAEAGKADKADAQTAYAADHAYATALFTALAAARQAENDEKRHGSHPYAAEVAAIQAQEAKILKVIFEAVGE